MAEFCLACWNKLNGTDDTPGHSVFSKDFELCEGCGEWKNVIIAAREDWPRSGNGGLF